MKRIERPTTAQETAEVLSVAEFLLGQALEVTRVLASSAAVPEPFATKMVIVRDHLLAADRILALDAYDLVKEWREKG